MFPLAFCSLAAVFTLPRKRLVPFFVEGPDSKEDIVAVVSHDLKGPLSAIQIGVDFIRHILEGNVGEKERGLINERLAALEWSVTQASGLIQDVLDSKKFQLGGFKIEKKFRRPSELVEGCLQVLSPLAERKNVNLKVEISCDDLIAFDMERMKQVLGNLIINGIQHVERFGRITIGNEDLGDEIRFYVKDDGYGINPSEKERIFDLYWQGKQHRRDGSGMGLAIAKGFVEMHGGRIWVENEPEKGSNFQFTIPKEVVFQAKKA